MILIPVVVPAMTEPIKKGLYAVSAITRRMKKIVVATKSYEFTSAL
jgi:hypothetical protein